MVGEQTSELSLKAAYAFGVERGLENEINAIREMDVEWDLSYNSSVRCGYVIALFEKHKLFDEFRAQHWTFGKTRGGEARYRRYIRLRQQYEEFISRDLEAALAEELVDDRHENAAVAFELEAQLQDFIAQNLPNIPIHGKRLSLHVDADGREGVEFPTDVGRIDILARDESGAFYVFELKRAASSDHAIGQLARYMGWVKQTMAEGKDVHGVVVAKTISDRLRYAIAVLANISLFEYEIGFRLNQAKEIDSPVRP